MIPSLLILDLDGTVRRCIVPGQPCPNRLGQQMLIPGARDHIHAHLARPGAQIAWASNQGGIGLGFMRETDHVALVDEMEGVFLGIGEDARKRILSLWCPHAPAAGCDCRKPRPGMLLRALAATGTPAALALFVGDQDSDRLAAEAAGVAFMWAAEWRDARRARG